MFDINDDQDQTSKFINRVFKTGVQIAFPSGKGDSSWIFLPAHVPSFDVDPAKVDPMAVCSYRRPDGGFTAWVNGFIQYGFFGPERNYTLLSPKSFDRDAFDPMGVLYETARSYPDFCHLAGLGRDGKKDTENKDAYKQAILSQGREMRIVNAFALEGKEAGKNVVLVCPKSVLGTPNNDKWGVLGQLQRKLPPNYRTPVVDNKWNTFYQFGDPTDPASAHGIRIFKDRPPNGGLDQFNAEIVVDRDGNPDLFIVNEPQIRDRWYLGDILGRPEVTELTEMMIDMFGPAHPKLVQMAFQNRVPGIANRLKQAGVLREDRVRQVGGLRDEPRGEASPYVDRPLDQVDEEQVDENGEPRPVTRARSTSASPVPASAAAAPARFAPRPAPGAVPAATAAATATARPAAFAPRNTASSAPAPSPNAARTVAPAPRNAAQLDQQAVNILEMLDQEEAIESGKAQG
jgi:hypothetical protein